MTCFVLIWTMGYYVSQSNISLQMFNYILKHLFITHVDRYPYHFSTWSNTTKLISLLSVMSRYLNDSVLSTILPLIYNFHFTGFFAVIVAFVYSIIMSSFYTFVLIRNIYNRCISSSGFVFNTASYLSFSVFDIIT